MATKRERAREKYRQQHGTPPPNDAALTAFMSTLSTSDYSGCSDNSLSYDSSPSYDGGSSFDGGSCGGGE